MGTAGALGDLSVSSTSQNGIALEPWVFLIEYPWFFAWGVTLGLAALAFLSNSRTLHGVRRREGSMARNPSVANG